jgi:hypothetical protein
MKRAIVVAIVGAFVAAPALADFGTISLKETGTDPSVAFTIYARNFTGGIGAYTGRYLFDIQSGTGITVPGITSYTQLPEQGFCIEMSYSTSSYADYKILALQDAPLNEGPLGAPMGSDKARYIGELWAEHGDDATMAIAQNRTAFQLAIWEIVYEDNQGIGTWDVTTTTGSAATGFRAVGDASTLSLANTWLSQINGTDSVASNLFAYSNLDYQDYVIRVPIPGTILLGLVGLAALRRKLRQPV